MKTKHKADKGGWRKMKKLKCPSPKIFIFLSETTTY